jgi:hydroxyacylglutathione hydrolase
MKIKKFTFNPFQENTYVLYDQSKDCLIIDPGCETKTEENELSDFIEQQALKPTRLINTHCHIDHILGNAFVANKYDLALEAHQLEIPILEGSPKWGEQYGIHCAPSPKITKFLAEGDLINCGDFKLDVLFVPGHSPGHVALVNRQTKVVINGDVLFQQSYGRVDLPGGNINDLADSIINKLFKLPDDYVVYAGHMGETSIGIEKQVNPILHHV